MKMIGVILLGLTLSGCSVFGGKKTQLVPKAYMPDPPAILMKAPKDLHTIKKGNITVTTDKVIVESPKGE